MVRRDAVTAARECAAMATGTPWRATATTSAIERERPSMVTEAGMREEATCKSGETPSGYERASDEVHPRHSLLNVHSAPATRRLPRPCHLCPGRRRLFRHHELRVSRIRLYAPVEDHVLAADMRHSQRAVVQHRAGHDLENVPESRPGEQRIAGVSARGREVDRREIGNRAGAVEP